MAIFRRNHHQYYNFKNSRLNSHAFLDHEFTDPSHWEKFSFFIFVWFGGSSYFNFDSPFHNFKNSRWNYFLNSTQVGQFQLDAIPSVHRNRILRSVEVRRGMQSHRRVPPSRGYAYAKWRRILYYMPIEDVPGGCGKEGGGRLEEGNPGSDGWHIGDPSPTLCYR